MLLTELDEVAAHSGADVVGVYFEDLETGDVVVREAETRMHAASTMKVPVLIQLFRDQEAGRLSLDDSVPITKTFRSIVDGSSYDLGAPDDSDTTLYRRIGEQEGLLTLAELLRAEGYSTGAVVSNVQVDARGVHFEQGFLRFLTTRGLGIERPEFHDTPSSRRVGEVAQDWLAGLEDRG